MTPSGCAGSAYILTIDDRPQTARPFDHAAEGPHHHTARHPLQPLAPAPWGDVFASWQLTGSRDFWDADHRPLGDAGGAQFLSPAIRLLIPLGWRASLEVTSDYVQTNETPEDRFRVRSRTAEVAAIAHVSPSSLVPAGFGDLLAGVELKRQQCSTLFTGIDIADGQADVGQLVMG